MGLYRADPRQEVTTRMLQVLQIEMLTSVSLKCHVPFPCVIYLLQESPDTWSASWLAIRLAEPVTWQSTQQILCYYVLCEMLCYQYLSIEMPF